MSGRRHQGINELALDTIVLYCGPSLSPFDKSIARGYSGVEIAATLTLKSKKNKYNRAWTDIPWTKKSLHTPAETAILSHLYCRKRKQKFKWENKQYR